jgi:hypothetical protein
MSYHENTDTELFEERRHLAGTIKDIDQELCQRHCMKQHIDTGSPNVHQLFVGFLGEISRPLWKDMK